jgi:hypothetical protein
LIIPRIEFLFTLNGLISNAIGYPPSASDFGLTEWIVAMFSRQYDGRLLFRLHWKTVFTGVKKIASFE